jgi:predicted metalloendopeptidase
MAGASQNILLQAQATAGIGRLPGAGWHTPDEVKPRSHHPLNPRGSTCPEHSLISILVLLIAASARSLTSDVPISGILFAELDQETRPQDDFYQFANGAWLDATPIPSIYSGYSVYHQVNEEAEKALKEIVEAAAASKAEPGSEAQQVGDIFNSWMDVDSINALGVEAVREELDQVASITDTGSLVRVMAQLTRAGIQTPYLLEISPDLKNSARNAVYVGQSGLTMPDRDYYLVLDNENFTKAREALPAYMQGMLVRAGADPGGAGEQAQRVYAIEHALAEVQWDNVTNRDPLKIYNPIALDVLDSNARTWMAIDRSVLGLQEIDMMVLYQPSYFSARLLLQTIPIDDWKPTSPTR